MLSLRQPSDTEVRGLLKQIAQSPFSYEAVGCVDQSTPRGFRRDVHTVALGRGEDVWTNAREAIRRWAVFPTSMVRLVRLEDEIREGLVVAVIARAAGIWTTNPARVLTVHDERGRARRFGFTYGTLPGHVECGEERFGVQYDAATGQVTYRIDAVSRPNHLLAWMAYPYTRLMQARFRRLSADSVCSFVHGCGGASSSNG